VANYITGENPLLSWVNDLINFYTTDEIKIPKEYRNQVLKTKELLQEDTSGLVNSMLDFAINGALVQYTVETDNKNLTELLNDWLKSINSSLRGKIPTGINALAKEYFRERWKGSSHLLLRVLWERDEDFLMPSTLWFVNGEDIIVKNGDQQIVSLDKIEYNLRKNKEEYFALPKFKNETIYVQKPFEAWSSLEPTPFLIRRGLFRNLSMLKVLEKKGEKIVAKALEYLLLIKKGTEKLFLEGSISYDKTDLEKIKNNFSNMLDSRNTNKGTTAHVAQFDTDISEYIPEYERGLKQALYTPIERRILFGLGLVDVVTGASSSRRESTLNPKPFVNEVNQGIEDYKKLLEDIMEDIVDKNKASHRKLTGKIIRITSTPVKIFVDDKFRAMVRSWYDRGLISKKSAVESSINFNFNVEVDRRKQEDEDGLEDTMYPPVTQNQEQYADANQAPVLPQKTPLGTENINDDKKGIEKKNFNQSTIICPDCGEDYTGEDLIDLPDEREFECPECGETVTLDYLIEEAKILEQAPYRTNKSLPPSVKNLPSGAKTIWRKTFNSAYPKYGEDSAIKIAWTAVKNVYKKVGDKWVRKSKGVVSE